MGLLTCFNCSRAIPFWKYAFYFDDSSFVCEHCGQTYPPRELSAKSRAALLFGLLLIHRVTFRLFFPEVHGLFLIGALAATLSTTYVLVVYVDFRLRFA